MASQHKKGFIGERHGTLTAVKPTEKRYYGQSVWLWRCDCGEEFEYSSSLIYRKKPMCPTCTEKMRADYCRRARAAKKRNGGTGYDLRTLENLFSGVVNASNTSGAKYVYYLPKKNKWRVMVNFERRYLHVGIFDSFDAAVAQRDAAIKQLYERKKDEKEILEDLREQRTPHRWVRERMTNTGIVYAGEINIKGKRQFTRRGICFASCPAARTFSQISQRTTPQPSIVRIHWPLAHDPPQKAAAFFSLAAGACWTGAISTTRLLRPTSNSLLGLLGS